MGDRKIEREIKCMHKDTLKQSFVKKEKCAKNSENGKKYH